jgi:hypothetical protein
MFFPRPVAEAVYHRGPAGAIGNADYKKLQDYIFRHIAAEAGRLGMAVHLHVEWGPVGARRVLPYRWDQPAVARIRGHGSTPAPD